MNVFERLKSYYPDSKVENLFQTDSRLYSYIQRISKNREITISEYLNEFGFEYIKQPTGFKSEFDLYNVRKLIKKYGFTQTKIGEILGVTRAEISRKILNNIGDTDWTICEVNDHIEELIVMMIEDELYTFESEEVSIYIRSVSNETVIVIAKDGSLSFMYDIPNNLYELIKEHKMDVYSEEEALLKQNIEFIYVMGRKMAQPTSKIRTKLNNYAKKNNETIEESVNRLGFDGIVDMKTYSDSKIVEILKKYVNYNNIVSLPVKAKDYQMLLTRAGRCNMSIDEYVQFFGFVKENTRLGEIFESKYSEIEQELALLANFDKEVYISTQSDLYKKLYPFSKHRNLSLNELVELFGYKRIMINGEYDDSILEDNRKIILLNEIKEIVGDMKRTEDYQKKVCRSRVLVEKMKDLYDYRCQICDRKNPIPLIMKDDCKYYVEVHHIIPISDGYENDEIENKIIDTYKNTLVLCAHHHKVVHYENGGYGRIIKNNKNYFLVNDNGDSIEILYNNHID